MQKEVFASLRNLAGEEGVRKLFEPHRMGMYSEEVAHLVAGLVRDGLVICNGDGPIALTEAGKPLASELLASGKAGVEVIRSVKELLNGLEYPDLIIYVYSVYPKWDDASEVGHYMRDAPRRRALATRLYQAGRISVERAALVAGEPLEKFMKGVGVGGLSAQ